MAVRRSLVLLRRRWQELLLAASAMLLGAGVVAYGLGADPDAAWLAATLLGLLHATVSLGVAVHRRQAGVDVIAWLALAGALVVDELLAGAVITVMLATGVLLEARAEARAQRELSLLVQRSPRTARRRTATGVVEVPAAAVVVGDRLVVGAGEIVPADGRLAGPAVLDESALTGEPLPVRRRAGEAVRSGVVNAGAPCELVVTAPADRSTYAGLVRMVEQAQADRSPFVRTADRFAVAFVPLTLALAGGAWAVAGQPARAVAVLVVATPCPLLLAAPIAIISGVSRAARSGALVKNGSALERLAAGRVLLFDKTGTLTHGRPVLTDVVTAGGAAAGPDADGLLALAASLDQVSPHVLAGAIVTAARERGLALDAPQQVRERHGHGIEGLVRGRRVRLGKAAWIVGGEPPAWVRHAHRRAALDGSLTVFVAVDGVPAGVFLFEDPIRPDAPRMIRAMRDAGISRVVLVTGDRADTAESVGRIVGVDAVRAEQDPAEKLAVVLAEQANGPTVMVGDGINDAPALAVADVGVALAARGVSASAEAAQVVLTVDRVDALADTILIARRSRAIALRAVITGMGLSFVAMLAAAAGLLPPAAGAVLQEGIDVAAIGIALTALLPARLHTVAMAAADVATARTLFAQHQAVRPLVERVRTVADSLTDAGCAGNGDLTAVRDLLDRLEAELLPHERAEEAELLPIVTRALGGPDPTGALSRTHAEIERQIGALRRLLDDLPRSRPEDVVDLRRLLYGLYAVLRLHNEQEEEAAFSLIPREASPPDRAPAGPAEGRECDVTITGRSAAPS